MSAFAPPERLVELQPGARMVAATHRYYLGECEVAASVTERIATDITEEEFDAARMSAAVFALCERMRAQPRRAWTERQLEQYERHGRFTSAVDIAAHWEANRQNGTETHRTIELLLRGECALSEPRAQTPEARLFLHFYRWLSARYEVIAVEAPLVVPALQTGGTIDAVCRERGAADRRDVMLVDWKTMAPVLLESAPVCRFFALPNCKRAKHEIQLNLYAEMLEAVTEYRATRLLVVYLDAAFGAWDLADVPRRPEAAAYCAALRERCAHPLLVQADAVKALRTR